MTGCIHCGIPGVVCSAIAVQTVLTSCWAMPRHDIGANAGCVSVGIDHDTAQFAVNAIRRWRDTMGGERYPRADRLMITADGGGSNGSRVRLWKVELQKFADETGLTIGVCHYPPG